MGLQDWVSECTLDGASPMQLEFCDRIGRVLDALQPDLLDRTKSTVIPSESSDWKEAGGVALIFTPTDFPQGEAPLDLALFEDHAYGDWTFAGVEYWPYGNAFWLEDAFNDLVEALSWPWVLRTRTKKGTGKEISSELFTATDGRVRGRRSTGLFTNWRSQQNTDVQEHRFAFRSPIGLARTDDQGKFSRRHRWMTTDLNRILDVWDPLGVYGDEEYVPTKEYDCLVTPLVRALEADADTNRLTELLTVELRDHFEIGANRATKECARVIVDWYRAHRPLLELL